MIAGLSRAPDTLGPAVRLLIERASVSREEEPDAYRVIAANRDLVATLLARTVATPLDSQQDRFRTTVRPAAPDAALAPDWLPEDQEGRAVALLFYVLWFAEHSVSDTVVLSEVATAIAAEAQDTNVVYDWTRRSDRRLLQYAIEYIASLGYIAFHEGSAEEWAEERANTNLLLEFRRSAMPQHLGIAAHATDDLFIDSRPLPALGVFVPQADPVARMYRWLLFHPQMTRDDDPEAFDELTSHTADVANTLERGFGLVLDLGPQSARALAVPTDAQAKRLHPMRLQSGDTVIAVLVAGEIRRRVDAGDPALSPTPAGIGLTRAYLESLLEDLRTEHAERWKTEYRTCGISRVYSEVLPKLLALGIVKLQIDESGRGEELVITHQAAHYRAQYSQNGGEDEDQ